MQQYGTFSNSKNALRLTLMASINTAMTSSRARSASKSRNDPNPIYRFNYKVENSLDRKLLDRRRWEASESSSQGDAATAPLAIFAIEEISNRLSPSLVRFLYGLAFVGVGTPLDFGISLFGFAALRAAVGKAGLIRLKLEFF